MNNPILIFIFIIVVFVLGGLFYIYNPDPTEFKNPKEVEPVACTMDAKLCPDGSYVGRIGPDCNFAECLPSETSAKLGPATTTPIFEDGTKIE